MLLERLLEHPELATDTARRVGDPPRGVAGHALPVRAVVGDAPPDDLLDPFAPLHVEIVPDEEPLARGGAPREAAADERGQWIAHRRLVAKRFEQRQKELLGRIGAAIGERARALRDRQCGDEVQHGGAAARRKPRGLGERGNPVDVGPVERLEHRQRGPAPACVGGRLGRVPQAIRPAPRRVRGRPRLDPEPRAVGNPHPGALEAAGVVPPHRREPGSEAVDQLHEAE